VWARSKLGEGTTFVLRLRRFGVSAAPGDTVVSVSQKASAGKQSEEQFNTAAAGRRAHG